MNCRPFLIVAILSLALPVYGQSKTAPAKVRNDRLSRESEVQTRVSGEMTQLVEEFNELVNEVQSNQAYTRVDGASLDQMKKSLDSTEKSRVRKAAAELNRAINNKEAGAAHVKEASLQVKHAKTELTQLLRQANALMLEETIGRQVQDLIRDQQAVARKTAQAAREQVQQLPLTTDPADLAQEQRQLAKRVKALNNELQQALDEELTDEAREKLQKAAEIAKSREIEEKQQQAVDDLDKEELPEAYEEQEQILKALNEIADTFSGVEKSPTDAEIEALRMLLEEQIKIRMATEATPDSEFSAMAPGLQLDQLNLNKELPQGSPAAAEMAEAVSALEKGDKAAAVAAQMMAEAALMAAIEDAAGPGPGVLGAKGEAGTDDKGDGDSDKDEEGQGNMGKGKKGKSKKPGPDPGNSDDPNSEPMDPSMEDPMENAEIKPALAKNTPGRVNNNPKPGENQFEKTGVEGKLPAGATSTWTPLNRKERDALNENFARELPREYRDMLKVYFEELSK